MKWKNEPGLHLKKWVTTFWATIDLETTKIFWRMVSFYKMLGSIKGWTGIGIRCTRLRNYVELFWNSLDNAPTYVFYLEMKVEVGVHDIRSRFTPLLKITFPETLWSFRSFERRNQDLVPLLKYHSSSCALSPRIIEIKNWIFNNF